MNEFMVVSLTIVLLFLLLGLAWIILAKLWHWCFPAKPEGKFCPQCGGRWDEHTGKLRWCPIKEPAPAPRDEKLECKISSRCGLDFRDLVKAIDEGRKLHASMVPAAAMNVTAKSLREMQASLPWITHYNRDFRASPMAWKDFGHALLHVTKASGKIAAMVNDAEHAGSDFADVEKYIADLVICALRMANTCPGRTIDLQDVTEKRIANKNTINPEAPAPMENK